MECERVRESARWRSGRGMYNHAGRFVDDHQVVIFVNNFDWNFFRGESRSRQNGTFNFYLVVGSSLVRGFNDAAVDQNIGVFNQSLQTGATPVFDAGGEKRIETLSGFIVGYRKRQRRILIEY